MLAEEFTVEVMYPDILSMGIKDWSMKGLVYESSNSKKVSWPGLWEDPADQFLKQNHMAK